MVNLEVTRDNDLNEISPIQRFKQRRQPKRKKAAPSKYIKKGLGDRLKEWRKDQRLTLAQLAKKLRIGITTISEIENNKSLPSAETLASLHLKTNLNILWLMFREGNTLQDENEDQPRQLIEPTKPKKVIKKTIFNMSIAELSQR